MISTQHSQSLSLQILLCTHSVPVLLFYYPGSFLFAPAFLRAQDPQFKVKICFIFTCIMGCTAVCVGRTTATKSSAQAMGLVDCMLQIVDCSRRIVNHSPAARDLRILLAFFQHPTWFISLQTIKICGLLLNNKLVITLKSLTCLQECQKQVSGTCFTRPSS